MWKVKYYWSKLKYRMTNLNGFMDYVWVAITLYNLYGVYLGLSTGNLGQAFISGLFLCVSFSFLFR